MREEERFTACDLDNYRKPRHAAGVFDPPLVLLVIYHVIEIVRTLLLVSILLVGPSAGCDWLMRLWYLLSLNAGFGLVAVVKAVTVLGSVEGAACAQA